MNNDIIAGPWVTESEIELVTQMMRDGWHNYKYVEQFEEEFAAYIGRKYCLMTPCCTHAIHLSLLALGIGPGDEVIVPELTWTGSIAPIVYCGATPVIVDVAENWCTSAHILSYALTEKTKALIAVDLYGNIPNYDEFLMMVHGHDRNVQVIEDAAEGLGSVRNGRKAGKHGTASCFSFHRTKTMTTGEGGAFLTDDEDLFKKAKILRDLGRDPEDMFRILHASVKYMPSNLMGALALGQLNRIDELVGRKREIMIRYMRNMPDLKMNQDDNTVYNGAWATAVEFKEHKAAYVAHALAQKDIPSRPFFYPLSSQPAYTRYAPILKNKNAYSISERGLVLPSAYHITDSQIDEISEEILSIVHGAFRV